MIKPEISEDLMIIAQTLFNFEGWQDEWEHLSAEHQLTWIGRAASIKMRLARYRFEIIEPPQKTKKK